MMTPQTATWKPNPTRQAVRGNGARPLIGLLAALAVALRACCPPSQGSMLCCVLTAACIGRGEPAFSHATGDADASKHECARLSCSGCEAASALRVDR